MKMKLPRYDKVSTQNHLFSLSLYLFYIYLKMLLLINSLLQSAYNGRGDRADSSTWPEAEGPLTVRWPAI